MDLFKKIKAFNNTQVSPTIINREQVDYLIMYLLDAVSNDVPGDVVEFGCYVGESSKYLRKTLVETNSNKKLYVYDSFEGLPPLTKHEENTNWTQGGLKTTEEVLIENFKTNELEPPIITKGWFCDIAKENIPDTCDLEP